MSKKSFGMLVAVGGLLLLLVSVLADQFGIGAKVGGFGPKQIAGSAAGALALLVGLALMRGGGPSQES